MMIYPSGKLSLPFFLWGKFVKKKASILQVSEYRKLQKLGNMTRNELKHSFISPSENKDKPRLSLC
jgi:hypothetical protein